MVEAKEVKEDVVMTEEEVEEEEDKGKAEEETRADGSMEADKGGAKDARVRLGTVDVQAKVSDVVLEQTLVCTSSEHRVPVVFFSRVQPSDRGLFDG